MPLNLAVSRTPLSRPKKEFWRIKIGRTNFIIFVFAIWILPIILGVKIAKKKNRSPHWMWFGIYPMVGLIVCIIMALLPPLKCCQICSRKVTADAEICPFCRHEYSSDNIIPRKTKKQKIIIASIIIIILIGFYLLIVLTINSIFINSMPYSDAIQILQNNKQIADIIGENIQKDSFISGSISTNGDLTGNASFSFEIKGTKGKGRVYIQSSKKNGVWEFNKLIFYMKDNDKQSIDLLINNK